MKRARNSFQAKQVEKELFLNVLWKTFLEEKKRIKVRVVTRLKAFFSLLGEGANKL